MKTVVIFAVNMESGEAKDSPYNSLTNKNTEYGSIAMPELDIREAIEHKN